MMYDHFTHLKRKLIRDEKTMKSGVEAIFVLKKTILNRKIDKEQRIKFNPEVGGLTCQLDVG